MPTPKKAFNQPTARSNNTRHQNAVYPKPVVPVAVGNFLPPRNVSAAGLEVVVSYPSIKPGDVIALKFNGDDSFVPITVENQTSVSFWVSVRHIIRALGTTVDIQYTLGGDSAGQRSEILQLTVLPFMEGDFDMPKVTQATAGSLGVLDLATFEGDAEIVISPWLLIQEGQTVWLDMNSRVETLPILTARPVTAPEVIAGISCTISREKLELIPDESNINFPVKVHFEGNNSSVGAIDFPLLELQLKVSTVPPVVYEDFSNCPLMVITPGETIKTGTMHITLEAGKACAIADEPSGGLLTPPYFAPSGDTPSLPSNSILIDFLHDYTTVSFKEFDINESYSAYYNFYNSAGDLIHSMTADMSPGSPVRERSYTANIKGTIRKLRFTTAAGDFTLLDDFILTR